MCESYDTAAVLSVSSVPVRLYCTCCWWSAVTLINSIVFCSFILQYGVGILKLRYGVLLQLILCNCVYSISWGVSTNPIIAPWEYLARSCETALSVVDSVWSQVEVDL